MKTEHPDDKLKLKKPLTKPELRARRRAIREGTLLAPARDELKAAEAAEERKAEAVAQQAARSRWIEKKCAQLDAELEKIGPAKKGEDDEVTERRRILLTAKNRYANEAVATSEVLASAPAKNDSPPSSPMVEIVEGQMIRLEDLQRHALMRRMKSEEFWQNFTAEERETWLAEHHASAWASLNEDERATLLEETLQVMREEALIGD